MFTVIAIGIVVAATIWAGSIDHADARGYDLQQDNLQLLLHTRQGLQLITLVLAGFLLVTGITADFLAG